MQVQTQTFIPNYLTFDFVKLNDWKILEEIGFKVNQKNDGIIISRKLHPLDWAVIPIILVNLILVPAGFLQGHLFFGIIFSLITARLIYHICRIIFFKLHLKSDYLKVSALNWNYDKRSIHPSEIKKIIIGKSPLLSEIHMYGILKHQEKFKLLSTSSKYYKAREIFKGIKKKLALSD